MSDEDAIHLCPRCHAECACDLLAGICNHDCDGAVDEIYPGDEMVL